MKMFILISLLSFALAEPPVGDGYAPARSSHDHGGDLQRSSQEYGVPGLGVRSQKDYSLVNARSQSHSSFVPSSRTALTLEHSPQGRSSISQEYGAPSFRSGKSHEYGAPSSRSSLSQEYGVPSSRSLSQQYVSPNARNALSTDYGAPSVRSQDYNVPSGRLSQEYGVPQLRSNSQDYKTIGDFPSDSYSTPVERSPSSSYGQPDFRSLPSEEYGVPSQRSFGQVPSSQYGQPGLRNTQNFSPLSQSSIVSARQNKPFSSSRNFQSSFGPRSFSQNFGSPSTQYDVPSTRTTDSYSPSSKSISQSYLPSSRSVSQTYGLPNERSLSSEYGTPEGRTNLKTNAFASSFDTARSAPSSKYGVPSARDSMPSEQYGVPNQYDALSNQGYNYARNALDELLNQEPANYDFGYKVNDFVTGSDFGHTETRQENKAEGSYFVVLPDGTKQTVEYEADERGFKPRISVEPADVRSGYDDNAADLTRSEDGPY